MRGRGRRISVSVQTQQQQQYNGYGCGWTFLQRQHTHDWQVYVKVFNVSHSSLGNTNQTHETPTPSVFWAVLKKRGRGVGTQRPLVECQQVTPSGNSYGVSISKPLRLLYDPAILLDMSKAARMGAHIHHTHSHDYCSISLNSRETEA